MLRKWWGLLLVLLLLATAGSVAAKSYSAERFDTLFSIAYGGEVLVTETVVFKFDGGPYTFVFRELPDREVDQIHFVSAALDGRTLPVGNQAGQVEVTGGNPIKVTWHFAPTSDSTHTFTLAYRLVGALRKESGADVFYWRAVPEEHEYSIASSTVTVKYPYEVRLLEDPQLPGRTAQLTQQRGQFNLTTSGINADKAVSVRARFTENSLIQHAPQWQQAQLQRDQQMGWAIPLSIAAFLGTVLVGWAGLAAYSRKYPVEKIQSIPLGQVLQPPDDLNPAFAAMLLGNAAASYAMMMSTLVDLARRGVVQMTEVEQRRWFGTKKDLALTQALGGRGVLRAHERFLLDLTFEGQTSMAEPVMFSSVQTKYQRQYTKFARVLEDDFYAAGFANRERNAQANRISAIGLTGIFIGLVGLIMGFVLAGSGQVLVGLLAVGISLGLFVVGVVALVQGKVWNRLTPVGITQKQRWESFKKHVEAITGDEAQLQPDLFNSYFALTLAFGISSLWVDAYKKAGIQTPVSWLVARDGYSSGDMAWFSTISDSSSSSSGDGGGGDGGGGGGGGGSSGAG